MATEFKLPKLGESANTGVVAKVLVSVGDSIDAEQPVIELETDKATVEVPSSVAGVVKEVRVKEGDEIEEGAVIVIVAEKGEATGEEESAAESKAPEPPEETAEEEEESAAPVKQAEKPERKESRPAPATQTPAAPSVRRFARELGVNIGKVLGTGPQGRVSVEDVKAYVKKTVAAPAASRSGPTPPVSLPDFATWGPIRREPMTTVRRRTAEHLSLSWSQVAHVTQFDRADVTELEAERKHLAPVMEKSGGKLTVTVILARIVASALREFPKFNASLDMPAREIVYKEYCNVGVAVDTDRGLLVPVVKNADKKSLVQMAAEIADLAEKARNKKIQPDDLHGGCFTLTNLGSIGGTHFTPIVNWPEVAVLGIGRAYPEPRLVEGCLQTRLILPLSLSYDHRVVDGAEGARFLRRIVEALETPLLLAIQE